MMFRPTVLLLLGVFFVQNVQPSRLYNDITSLENKILELLEQEKKGGEMCMPTDKLDLNADGPQTPSPIDVNDCNGLIVPSNDENCVDIDISTCGTTNCILGFETNEKGCVTSCACKTEGLFQGDIMLSQEDVAEIETANKGENRAASKLKKRWNNIPGSGGTFVVPYTLDPSIQRNPRAVSAISDAMKQYAEETCIRFQKRTNEADYLEFFVGRGCYSYIGRTGGKQQVSIGRGCEWKGVVMHEMLHAMGFWHEHSRPDRDTAVIINMDNVNPKMQFNFKKMAEGLVNSMGSPYDIGSVMQYDGTAFSINKKPTILSKKTGQPVKAQRNGFSKEDLFQLRKMYNC
ncbi:hatching enzyme 1.2-like [Clavelina lepadiformis]|uniref:Metalloendopeptidase n=1 Tax=Clavelina lepadiformis TaxID=159417 RepID=A0ABP0G252_CLALP